MNKSFLSISIITASILSQSIASEALITEVESSSAARESDGLSMASAAVSTIDYNALFSSWDNIADFNNHCYESGKTEQRVLIPNGSMVNFAAAGIIGSTIRAASAFNEIPNPLGIAHSGVIVNDDPRDVFNLIVDLLPGGKDYSEANELSETEGKALINELKISY